MSKKTIDMEPQVLLNMQRRRERKSKRTKRVKSRILRLPGGKGGSHRHPSPPWGVI